MTVYTEEIGDFICAHIASGGLLSDICEKESMPKRQTVYLWSIKNQGFGERYNQALRQRALTWGESMIDDIEKTSSTPEAINKQKLLIETKKWIMGKLCKEYAERVTLLGDKDNPIQINLATALDARIAAARAAPVIEHEPAGGGLPVIDVESE